MVVESKTVEKIVVVPDDVLVAATEVENPFAWSPPLLVI
jgi:hypothetical protein